MQQTLFYIPHEIAGVPVFGFGLLLAVWVLGSVALLAWLGWRQGFGADTWGYVPLLVLVAAVIWWLLPALAQSQGLPIRGYGTMMLVAVVAATGLAAWRARRVGLNCELVLSLVFWMFVPGIIAARAFYVIEYWSRDYWLVYQSQGLWAMFGAVVNFTQGGLVVYGSLVGGILGLVGFARRYGLPLLAVCDLVAPSLMLGLALGRVGCVANGCCFGGICHLPWAITFPCDSPVHFYQVEHGQTFIYGLKLAEYSPQRPLPVIGELEPGSAAQQQGLKRGLIITRINGHPVEDMHEAALALMGAEKLSVATEGCRYVCRWPIEIPPYGGRPLHSLSEIDAIEGGREFIHGLKIASDGRGQPVIKELEPGSAAARQALKPGQRITMINGRLVESIDQAARALLDAEQISLATKSEPAGVGSVSRWPLQGPRPGSRPVQPVQPTQVYSGINALLLCLLLLAYDRFRRRDGELIALMLSIYPVGRFLLEIIRTDESPVFHTGLSISQNVSLLTLVLAAGLWFYILRQPPGTAFAKASN